MNGESEAAARERRMFSALETKSAGAVELLEHGQELPPCLAPQVSPNSATTASSSSSRDALVATLCASRQ